MFRVREIALALAVLCSLLVSAGCSSHQSGRGLGGVLPQTENLGPTTKAENGLPMPQNLFAVARGKALQDSDFDNYINTPLSPDDRKIAHALMRFMPANMRGDFVYYDGHRIMSNNAALVPYVSVTKPHDPAAPATQTAAVQRAGRSVATRRVDSDGGLCSPTDPYTGTGPYVRNVSNCGFNGGWGVVNLQCGTTQMEASNEDGYMYMESRDESGNTYEGGLFTHYGAANENDIDPYVAGLGVQLNNAGARYTCGTYIGVLSGATNPLTTGGFPMFFVSLGTLSNYDPNVAWQADETIYFDNPAWLFISAPGSSFNDPGYDAAGFPTPCRWCSISKVTSIAQHGDTWDGSMFGIDPTSGDNAIHWVEMLFGDWDYCSSSTTSASCTLRYSPDNSVWYAGEENYPSGTYPDAQSSVSPNGSDTESWDGVYALPPGSSSSVARKAMGAFVLPAPPPPCTLDSYGMCAMNTANDQIQYCYVEVWNVKLQDWVPRREPYTSHSVYAVYRSTRLQGLAYKTITKSYDGCTLTSTSWSPAEPRVTYGDPYLP